MSDEPKLLPCPFCGADAEIDQSRDFRAFTSGNFRLQAAIYCTACNCDMCLCYDDLPECDGDQLEAILRENWNRRVPAPAVPDDVAAVAETLRKATFTKGRMRGGVGGQTIEANMRSTFHEISAWDLEQAADALEAQAAELARKNEALQRIADWSDAYPTPVFPEPDFARAAAVLAAAGMSLDVISASNMRHATQGVGKIAKGALTQPTGD